MTLMLRIEHIVWCLTTDPKNNTCVSPRMRHNIIGCFSRTNYMLM
jgi:hypothetical protein